MPELPPDALFRICDNQCLDFETTADLPPLQAIIGQDRAVKALEFGLEIEEKGFNIYAAGPSGHGQDSRHHQLPEGAGELQECPPRLVLRLQLQESKQPQGPQPASGARPGSSSGT